MRIVDHDGTIKYYNGRWEYHREDGPAFIKHNGDKEWWVNGFLHREDGPAIECVDGYKEWCRGGRCHREDGPAVIYADGSKQWWINGQKSTEAEVKHRTNPCKCPDYLK